MDYSPPVSCVHGILQAKYWNGLPFPFFSQVGNVCLTNKFILLVFTVIADITEIISTIFHCDFWLTHFCMLLASYFYFLWLFIHRKKSEGVFFLPFHLNSSRPIDLHIASAQPTLQMHQEDKRQRRELISILIKGTWIGSGGWKPKDSSIWWDQGFNLFSLKRTLRNRFFVGAPRVWNKGHPPPTVRSDGFYSL